MNADPPRPQPVMTAREPRVIVVHHGGPSFFSTYWMLRLGIVALVLLGSGGRWMMHHFGGTHRGNETLDAFDDPAPVAAAPPAASAAPPAPPPPVTQAAGVHAPPPVAPHAAPPPLPPNHHVRR